MMPSPSTMYASKIKFLYQYNYTFNYIELSYTNYERLQKYTDANFLHVKSMGRTIKANIYWVTNQNEFLIIIRPRDSNIYENEKWKLKF